MGERGKLRRGAGGSGWVEVPGVDGDLAGEGGELAQGSKAAVEKPGDERASDEKKEEGSGGVELNGAKDGVPDPVGGRPVKDDDAAQPSAVVARIDEARTLGTEGAIVFAVDLEVEEITMEFVVVFAMSVGGRCGGKSKAEALPVL